MNGYYNNGGCTYMTDRTLYPDPFEKKAIRKMFSNTAWALIVSEVFTYIFYFAFSVFLYAAGFQESYTSDGLLIENAPMILMCSTSVTFSLICTSLIFGSGFHFKVSDIFDREKITAKKLLLTVLVSLGIANEVYVINMIISTAAYSLGYEIDYGIADPVSAPGWAAEVISSVILAPVFEEIFYRGIIMRSLSRVSKRFAIFASAVIFGLVHGNLYQFILGFCVGIVFAYADMKMNSVIPSILAHIAVNAHLYLYYIVTGDLGYLMCVAAFIIIGTAALLYVLKHYGIEFPEYTERHRKRCLPLLVCSVPAWLFAVYSVYSVFSSFTAIS